MTEKKESAAAVTEERLVTTCEGIVRDYLAHWGYEVLCLSTRREQSPTRRLSKTGFPPALRAPAFLALPGPAGSHHHSLPIRLLEPYCAEHAFSETESTG